MKWKLSKVVFLKTIPIVVTIAIMIKSLRITLNSLMLTLVFKALMYGKNHQNTRVLQAKGKIRQKDGCGSETDFQWKLAG